MCPARLFLLIFFLGAGPGAGAQLSYKVLYLGNSYTGVNNLPQLIHDAALSAGDTLIFDSYTPGGYQLEDHAQDANSLAKIQAGGWHYVVIQAQSQEPITFQNQFSNGANALYNQIKTHNPCAVTMPYMTWGRKNGDASICPFFPVACTYQSMDSVLRSRYLNLTASLNGEVSPVSVVWNYLRNNHPTIDLYMADESHPSMAGSYAAACCFYTMLFKKDPTLITYDPGLSPGDAANIRSAAKTTVFSNLQMWNYRKLPVSHFTYQVGAGPNQVILSPVNGGVRQSYSWDFGDLSTSTVINPSHSYVADGTYTITLTTANCDLQGIHQSFSDTVIQFCSHTPTVYTGKPWLCNYDTLWTQPADSYQWYMHSTPLPETNQFLADYARYNLSNFSVLSTINGCSELSKQFTQTADWSGFYFDIVGDPCKGNPVPFAALHANGSLPGTEKILWFKNGVPLPAFNDDDTLFISGPGKYACKIYDPSSNCPFDTTSYSVEYTCGQVTGFGEERSLTSMKVFPNPASDHITVDIVGPGEGDRVEIYTSTGRMIKDLDGSASSTIHVGHLPQGLYFIRLKSNSLHVLKFIRE